MLSDLEGFPYQISLEGIMSSASVMPVIWNACKRIQKYSKGTIWRHWVFQAMLFTRGSPFLSRTSGWSWKPFKKGPNWCQSIVKSAYTTRSPTDPDPGNRTPPVIFLGVAMDSLLLDITWQSTSRFSWQIQLKLWGRWCRFSWAQLVKYISENLHL